MAACDGRKVQDERRAAICAESQEAAVPAGIAEEVRAAIGSALLLEPMLFAVFMLASMPCFNSRFRLRQPAEPGQVGGERQHLGRIEIVDHGP